MTGDKILEVFDLYEKYLSQLGYQPKRFKPDRKKPNKKQAAEHILYLILEGKKLVTENRIEKAFRWLGFIQGTLWTYGFFSVVELKTHSMPR